MENCIFCREPGSSREHVVPEAIGGRKIIHRVCTRCNNTFGSGIDAKLVDHPFVQFARARLAIAGKSGIPNPLAQGTLANDPDARLTNLVSEDGTPPRMHPGLTSTKTPDGDEQIRVLGGTEAEVLTIVNKKLTRTGLQPITLNELRPHMKASTTSDVMVEICASTVSFGPALVKIAYEVAWLTLGDGYLDDSIGEGVRAALRDPTLHAKDLATRLDARIGIASNHVLVEALHPSADAHTILLFRDGARLQAWIRIFDVCEAIVPIAAVAPASVEKVITVDPVAGTWRDEPYEEALLRAIGFL